ncbi:capsule biosynthesis protein [Stutzerimonas nitrititolerans]|uniref:capsule biosynthesis protein n=1 Tax=Stutzerimonas nitrititolerans TaxID=2482751 RepID=UPI00289F6C9C|nr:capsule biosynthesis protein [Stutzerimonas nitrititolerans]
MRWVEAGLMRDVAANPWAAKARALDRYRWLLLRERHGPLGSALRFSRDVLRDWWFGLRARSCLVESVTAEPCDFLLLQSAPKMIKLQRTKLLKEGLCGRGYNLVETALQEPKTILRKRLLKSPPYPVPTRYFGIAAYAEWLAAHYQPRILLNERNGSLYAPFLRLALNARGGLLVHLAHATTVESSRRLGMNDYDYYFLFGRSSLEALQARKLRFGSSMAVLAGSHLIDRAFDMPPASPTQRKILVLGVGPDKEKKKAYQDAYSLVARWASENLEHKVLVKCHPRSDTGLWQKLAVSSNIDVLPADTLLYQALEQASVVVSLMSNAVIEAGLARRPIIYVGAGKNLDIFEQGRFFGCAVVSSEEFSARIGAIENNYSSSVREAENFAAFHLVGGFEGLERTLKLLGSLLSGEEVGRDMETTFLHSTI